MKYFDITDKVDFGDNDGDYIPITKCICGKKFIPWDFFITTDENDPRKCPNCQRKLLFTINIKVYEVKDE